MSIEALKEQARNHEQNEDWAKALQAYEEAIRRQSDEDQPDLGLYNRAGDLSTRLQDPIGAIGHYERAVELYLESELPNNAIAILKKILRNMPDRAEVYLRMGQIRASQGFLTDARDNFLIYAESMQHSGNMEEAFRALAEFADLAPEDVEIRLRLADQFQTHEKAPEALEQLFRVHHVLSARGDDAGMAGVEERIQAIDPEAVIPASSAGTSIPKHGRVGSTSRVSHHDGLGDGEIAFEGDFGRDSDEEIREEQVEDAPEGEGRWSSSAIAPDAPREILLDDHPDELVSEEDGISVPRLETTDFHPERVDAELEAAYIDFAAVEHGDDIVLEASPDEARDVEVDADLTHSDTDADTDTDTGAELDAFDPASDGSLDVFESGHDDATGEAVDAALDAAMDEEESTDDALQEDIGGELPLLTFDDDPEDSAPEGQLDHAAVAVETAVEDHASEFESLEGEDEWIGLEDESPLAEGASAEAESWSTGNAFELETVQFESLGEDELREYVGAHPESARAWEHMGRLVAARGDQPAAAEAFEAAHAAYAAERDFHSAMRSVRELLLLDPDSHAYHQRLVEYAHRGDDRTLLVSAFLELGDCLNRTGAPEKSDAVYQKVLDIDPGNARARSALGLVDGTGAAGAADGGYVDLGSMVLEKREKTTRWTVESQEPTTEDDFDFGAMLKQFRAKVAEHVDMDDVQAHYDLGTAYKEMGLLDEAISEFQQALRADGRNLATFEVLGQSFMEKGQPEAAIRTLRRATGMPFEVEDELLGIYYYLGRAYEELGNRDEAVEYYEKVFALDINFEDVTERLRSLR